MVGRVDTAKWMIRAELRTIESLTLLSVGRAARGVDEIVRHLPHGIKDQDSLLLPAQQLYTAPAAVLKV